MYLDYVKTIYLIRHSAPFVEIENYDNNDEILWAEFNRNMILSPKGEENARKLCEVDELKNIQALYASNSPRAIQTAKYLAERNGLKIKLDSRIDEREFGVKYLKEISADFTQTSFVNKDFKMEAGESLNEVDKRFQSFINDFIKTNVDNIAVVMHGIILFSYLQSVSDCFSYDGKIFKIKYQNKMLLNGKPKNPSIYKLEFNEGQLINIDYIEC